VHIVLDVLFLNLDVYLMNMYDNELLSELIYEDFVDTSSYISYQ
jgi:hypothetical protein